MIVTCSDVNQWAQAYTYSSSLNADKFFLLTMKEPLDKFAARMDCYYVSGAMGKSSDLYVYTLPDVI